jgi:hypothetical protein
MSENKKCSGCKEILPIENFYKNKLVIDGHSNYCIDCTRENSKKYFVRKKEKLSKLENDNLMKIALLSNTDSNNADNLMKIMMIEKMCKTILEELEHLKRDFVKTEMDVLK